LSRSDAIQRSTASGGGACGGGGGGGRGGGGGGIQSEDMPPAVASRRHTIRVPLEPAPIAGTATTDERMHAGGARKSTLVHVPLVVTTRDSLPKLKHARGGFVEGEEGERSEKEGADRASEKSMDDQVPEVSPLEVIYRDGDSTEDEEGEKVERQPGKMGAPQQQGPPVPPRRK